MATKSRTEAGEAPEPTAIHSYLGFHFIEYPEAFDFRLARGASRMTKFLGLFTLLVIGGLIAIGLLVKVHVKVPISGQMQPMDPEFVPAKIEGAVRVKVKPSQRVEKGEILVEVDSTEQREKIKKLENQRDSARQSVRQTDEEILAAQSQVKQAENRLASLEEQKATRQRELTEHKEQVALKLQDFVHQTRSVEIANQNAEANIRRLQGSLETQRQSRDAQVESLQLRIQSAQMEHDSKKKTRDSDERLFRQGAISQAQFDASDQAFRQAENALRAAQIELTRTEIDLKGRIDGTEKDLDQARLELDTQKMKLNKLDLDKQSVEYEARNKERSIEDTIRDIERQMESAGLEIQSARTRIKSAESNKKIAEFQVENFDLDLQKANADLEAGCNVVAPYEGYVNDILVQDGQKVQPGQPLVKLARVELEFAGAIESKYRERVEIGQPVKIKFDEFQRGGSEDVEHPGEVVRVTNETNKQGPKQVYMIKVRIDAPRAEEHKDEMPEINYGGTGNVLTQEMNLLKYWLLHKILKKV